MRDFFKKHYQNILLLGVIFVSLFLMGSSFLLLSEYSSEMEEQSGAKAKLYATETDALLRKVVQQHSDSVDELASSCAAFDDPSDLSSTMRAFQTEHPSVVLVRYFWEGTEYDGRTADPFSGDESSVILQKHEANVRGCLGMVTADRGDATDSYKNSLIAFGAPVPGGNLLDYVVVFYAPESISEEIDRTAAAGLFDRAEYAAFCASGGEVLCLFGRNLNVFPLHVNIYTALREQFNDKQSVFTLQQYAMGGEINLITAGIGRDNYIFTVGGLGTDDGGLYIISAYRAADVYGSGYTLVNTILGILIVLSFVMLVGVIYVVISRRVFKRRMRDRDLIDPVLNCPTYVKFYIDADYYLTQNRGTQFYMICAEIKHFDFIKENFGEQASLGVLQYLRLLYSKSMQVGECYGYVEGGEFYLMLHARDRDALLGRLRIIYNLIHRFHDGLSANYHLQLEGGVYEVARERTEKAERMIDYAVEAKNAVEELHTTENFRFYSDELRRAHEQRASIEARMESALDHGDFKVFYQPKLNMARNAPDGCEALVRWYEPETATYQPPGVFIPLFEANGFIIRLDKYIFDYICKFVHEASETGRRLIPISINVSRVTAAQPDFLSYYTEVKRRYHIRDGFLTLEFTESFAYESYDVLKNIINELHKNGFECSIDDFGSGFSSYNILKELPMDEIKLDKFFIDKGDSAERDNAILESVIKVAKTIGMKVTQEGVETLGDMDRLRRFGCDVVQGYYYSKPLTESDFLTFLDTHLRASAIKSAEN